MPNIIPFEQKLGLSNPVYTPMLEIIQSGYPEISRATGLFHKHQSQFMDNMLTVSHITPIRNLRQILAEMNRTRQALGEAHFNIRKKQVRIKEKKEKLLNTSGYERELLEIEIEEIEWQISNINESAGGAIRKLANYTLQYQNIQKEFGLENFDEFDFEEEEEKYHITKAFEQGLNAARSHGGIIDEGNQIYFEQIGVNGTVAQNEVSKYLFAETRMLQEGNEPTHEMQLNFLLSMAEKFKGCSKQYAKWKGMPDTANIDALIREMQHE